MAFIRALEEVYHSQVSSLNKYCCPETISAQSKEIARAARLILMIESLNCVEGSRDRRDDDLLPPLYERRDSLLVQIATFDLRARLLLLEPGLYLGLPYLPHCHRELLPLYLLNCTDSDICFRGRKVLAAASSGDEDSFTGSSERSAQQTVGAHASDLADRATTLFAHCRHANLQELVFHSISDAIGRTAQGVVRRRTSGSIYNMGRVRPAWSCWQCCADRHARG